jgi:hypothetical protein
VTVMSVEKVVPVMNVCGESGAGYESVWRSMTEPYRLGN